jgi:alginate O-acetyltransferase complex protein AlgI
LGGNRKGKVRRYINLFLTMLLGGLWHGAGWTFVLWGSLHGIYLIINHGFRALAGTREKTSIFSLIPARILTFIAVVVAWVFFRAHTFGDAFKVLKGMFGFNGIHPSNLNYMPLGNIELLALCALFLWVQLAPNTIDLSRKLKPTFPWLAVTVAAFVVSFLLINRISEFIYFQF